MRAAAFTDFGGTEHVAVVDLEDPTPGPGEAVVEVRACSLNHTDLWTLESDDVEGVSLPYVAGCDVAGVVRETADGVTAVSEGDRVLLCPNLTCGTCEYCREGPETLCAEYGIWDGGFAELAAVPADRLLALPDEVSFESAAALPIAYMTAWHMLRRAEVQAGDRVFVPGATGGVGVAALELAAVRGLETVASSRSAEKLAAAPGATHEVVAKTPDELRDEVASLGDVDAVLNHLGGPYTGVGLDVVRRGGRVVTCGRTTGNESTIDVADLFWQHKRVVGSTMGTQADLERVLGFVADGRLDPTIDATYALEEARAAFEAMADGDVVGKSVVLPQS